MRNLHFATTNLVEHFSGQSLLPNFEELLAVARILTWRHDTTQAYNVALNASLPPENKPARGSDRIGQVRSEDMHNEDENQDEDELQACATSPT